MKKYEQIILKITFEEMKDNKKVSKVISEKGDQGFKLVNTFTSVSTRTINDSHLYVYFVMEKELTLT